MTRFLFCLFLALSHAAHAFDVDSPYITKGEAEIELKNRFDTDDRGSEDGYRRHVFGTGYAPTDWWAFEIEGMLEKPANKGYRYRATEFENTFQFTHKGEYWLDVGGEIAYGFEHQDQDNDTLEVFLLLGKSTQRWQHLLNIGFETETGSNRDGNPTPELAAASRYEINDHVDIGLEYHADLGTTDAMGNWSEQKHRAGPVFHGEIWGGRVEYELGWLFGISQAAEDHVFKLNFGHEFSL